MCTLCGPGALRNQKRAFPALTVTDNYGLPVTGALNQSQFSAGITSAPNH